MLENAIVQRFLDSRCSEDELSELTHWLSIRVCPKCFSEDIEIEHFIEFDDFGEDIVEESIDCQCLRDTCLYSDFIDRYID
ncbi:hypothetical protein [Aliterella atlantica]|uniref:hypothetical protein n=1 Tax=Aliterella atlantica TaxID=1827278 RepID=UPI001364DAC1